MVLENFTESCSAWDMIIESRLAQYIYFYTLFLPLPALVITLSICQDLSPNPSSFEVVTHKYGLKKFCTDIRSFPRDASLLKRDIDLKKKKAYQCGGLFKLLGSTTCLTGFLTLYSFAVKPALYWIDDFPHRQTAFYCI